VELSANTQFANLYIATSLDIRGYQYVWLSRLRVFVCPEYPSGLEEYVQYTTYV
jgi:hypothetical protein